ncbi:hypothetical protein FA09DRAFT_328224 [Tilletiopsis washingtonensis]|uniref:Bacterial surface antigen (D15) domain-containing protein n=1 Tax=Tilletiopsis washingtonensis TaxID=58919 RepID=A0A316ZF09_9BASI|nr:hypothetical protein FA09DRAFT_328224 [Tilletiopsis washingtonensis]PWO00110.1 hypothetical protein FA09DRAFT_328224 [Tilletiopsis washingtonensis]
MADANAIAPAPPSPAAFPGMPYAADASSPAPDAASILRAGMPPLAAAEAESLPAFDDSAASASPSTSATPPAEPTAAPHNLESAQAALAAGQIPRDALRLSSIQLEGCPSLRRSFLQRLISPYITPAPSSAPMSVTAALQRAWAAHRAELPRAGEATELLALLAVARSVAGDLQALDLFDSIDASVLPSSSSSGPEEVDLLFTLREKSRVLLKSSTDVGNGEGSASIQGRVRNCFGGAECLEGNATVGTRTRRSFNVSLSAPLLANPDHQASLSAYALDRDCSNYLSCSEGLRGARVALRSSLAPGVSHEMAYELVWRQLGRLAPSASLSVRRLAVPTLKSSLSYTYARDTRLDALLLNPAGSSFKFSSELAGLGGDTAFLKSEVDYFRPRAFGAGWAYTIAARAGAMKSLDARATPLVDRFHLGGPISLRMFRHNSLGPKDGLDSLGGDAYWAAGASLLAPMPYRAEWPLKLHAFVNAGQVCALDQSQPLRPAAFAPLAQPSSSAGIGIVYTQGPLRVELNAGLPLTARMGDGTRKGFQLGIGLTFL